MTWLLVVTICVVMGPGDAECRQEASRPVTHGPDCGKMIKATEAYLTEQAASIGAEIIYLHAGCKRGRVS
jgi:hypothetical protein